MPRNVYNVSQNSTRTTVCQETFYISGEVYKSERFPDGCSRWCSPAMYRLTGMGKYIEPHFYSIRVIWNPNPVIYEDKSAFICFVVVAFFFAPLFVDI